ncbi:alpha/beta-hydrolase [Aaosphaeria arxii CBS 175.79]|uniref:Alpha/beta-hydrolase n=1 Tax=Aaosphaeria arxii CBS 175.79 TaxID=1450172 RepID=A0A6A5Y311_9PLEO|nr:alpha/beta-hydrolase [Aaosphaeria arxii CBS 175.79]KAF2019818.1 alpha/beta-hydrolase [Aaosphaeria arxii CBS 175.79]
MALSPSSPSAKASLPPLPLPADIKENYAHCPTIGLTFHFLEAGYTPERNKPLILLVHGYPELAFSWRKVMPSLAAAGYYVVAYDQRGYGRTTGWDDSTFAKTDLSQFTKTQLVQDAVALVYALGYREVKCIVGHDFGAVTASICALTRPDFFKSTVHMSHPFKMHSGLPFNTAHGDDQDTTPGVDIQRELAKLPEPRKHYKWYNSTAVAAFQWSVPLQGLEDFLRGYLHVKSADWEGNKPFPLDGWKATELAKMPYYYIMPLHKSMPETIASMMETEDANKTKTWMPEEDLAVYVQEWSRTGFQGGLNWYRTTTDPSKTKDLDLFAGKKIECPVTFISGAQDWGNYQEPGALENYPNSCLQFKGVHLIPGAGHWPQQEQPEKVVDAILNFLNSL